MIGEFMTGHSEVLHSSMCHRRSGASQVRRKTWGTQEGTIPFPTVGTDTVTLVNVWASLCVAIPLK